MHLTQLLFLKCTAGLLGRGFRQGAVWRHLRLLLDQALGGREVGKGREGQTKGLTDGGS